MRLLRKVRRTAARLGPRRAYIPRHVAQRSSSRNFRIASHRGAQRLVARGRARRRDTALRLRRRNAAADDALWGVVRRSPTSSSRTSTPITCIGVIGLDAHDVAAGSRRSRCASGDRVARPRALKRAEEFGIDRSTFPMRDHGAGAGTAPLERKDYAIVPFPVDHRGSASLGYALVEEERKGRFNPDLARELGIPEGPLWGRDPPRPRRDARRRPRDRAVACSSVRQRPGRRVVITGDTRPCARRSRRRAAPICWCTRRRSATRRRERAVETGHSTAREAALVARDAGVRRSCSRTSRRATRATPSRAGARGTRGVREDDGREGRAGDRGAVLRRESAVGDLRVEQAIWS